MLFPQTSWPGRQGAAVPIALAGELVLVVSGSAPTRRQCLHPGHLSLHLAWPPAPPVSCSVQLRRSLVVLGDWGLKYFRWFLFTWVLYGLTEVKPWCLVSALLCQWLVCWQARAVAHGFS